MELTPGQWFIMFAALVFASFAFNYRMRRTGPESLRHRLRTIMIPEFELEDATIVLALDRLGDLAARHDPKGMGVPFTTAMRTDETATVKFERQSLWDALEGVALLFSLYYHIDDARKSVELYLPTGDEELVTRQYKPSGERFPKPWTNNFESEFRDIGLELEADGFARYESRTLTVRAPENTLNLLEKMFGLDPVTSDE